jgi:hypothetical protein
MFTRRRKLAYEGLHPETRHGGDRRSKTAVSSPQLEDLKSFTDDTGEKTGQSRETVQRDAARGMKISEQALAALRGKSAFHYLLPEKHSRYVSRAFPYQFRVWLRINSGER